MMNDPRGILIQHGAIMRIDNARVEEVSSPGRTTGFIIVSYAVPQSGRGVSTQTLQLNVNSNTVVLNSLGRPFCLCDIREGMWITAVFSSRMTRSIPPQTNAFLIIARPGISTQPPSDITVDRIAFIDVENRMLTTGNPFDINSQTRFVIPESTPILNRSGRPTTLRALRPGQMVRITHANFQTASIPPQTTAFLVQLM